MVAEAALEAAAALAGLGQLLARLGQLGGQGELLVGRARSPGGAVLGGLPLHGGDREARGPGQVVEPPLVVGVVPDDADGGPVGGAVPAVRVRRRLPGGGGDRGAEDAGVRGRGHGDGRRELESLDPREFEFRGGGERVGEESLRH